MQNILDIKQKLEEQEKLSYGQANLALATEQEKLQELLRRKSNYDAQLVQLSKGKLDIAKIQHCKKAIDGMKSLIRDQMMEVHKAQKQVEVVRQRLNQVMQERKTHENLKEKQFEQFKEELAQEEMKVTDGLVSYTFHQKQQKE